ncbi:sensor histidine kinase [Virgibacillus doumboii]|uniref:sensor histidine kinase n=1 Tax=Virgibacillus doumboii TaxID=2697503 RepID=UPI0013E060BA|nr:sensor histidine kinase [Virgibacillus doumboii]
MKDFLKDSQPFILFYFSQVILVILISQLALVNTGNSADFKTIAYIVLLSASFLVIFLVYRFIKFREFYIKRENTYFPEPPNRLLEHVKTLTENDHREYQQEINNLQQQKELEFNFMQQWVHQMKTPVSVMYLTLQKERMQLPEDFSHSMQEEIERLQQGLEQALYQSRLQKFDRDFHVQKVSLQQLVRTSIKDFKSSFIRNQVFPETDIDENINIATDPKWLGFVLNQLLSNAIKYSKPDSEKIMVQATEDDSTVRLSVKDTGYGMPSQDVARVFDPFFTGINGRKFRESTGMGLYLSKQICDALGHDISVQSEESEGTTITITFETNLTTM